MTKLKRAQQRGTTYEQWNKARRERWPEATHHKFQSFVYRGRHSIVKKGDILIPLSTKVADWDINHIKDAEEAIDMPNVNDITQGSVLKWLLTNRVTIQEAETSGVRAMIIRAITGNKPSPTGISRVETAIRGIKKITLEDDEPTPTVQSPAEVTRHYRVHLTFMVRKLNVESYVNMGNLLGEVLQRYVDEQYKGYQLSGEWPWERLTDFGVTKLRINFGGPEVED